LAREPNERKGGVFGGRTRLREDLRDVSGNDSVGFEDTWLGDLLGADGKVGTQGPGLRRSWFGARRDGPGSAANLPNIADIPPEERPTATRTRNNESYYRESGGDGLRNPYPESSSVASGPTRRSRVTGAGAPSRRMSDSQPEVMTDGPTIGTPAVPADVSNAPTSTASERPSIVQRPSIVSTPQDVRPTIETSTSYPLRAKLSTIIGPNSNFVKTVLPAAMDEVLTGGAQNNLNKLVAEVEGLPDTQTKQEVLAELRRMRDSIRGGGGGY
jgi:hypothetical protein